VNVATPVSGLFDGGASELALPETQFDTRKETRKPATLLSDCLRGKS
jgi:hypothetical protein